MAWLARILGALRGPRRWGGLAGDAGAQAALQAELARVLRLDSIGQLRRFVHGFEERFAARLGVAAAVGVNSGTSALYLALRALGVGPGDEVLTVANTWVSTLTAVRETGAECRFVDVDPASGQMDPDAAAAAVGGRTRVILPVHMYGIPADMPRILDVARRHGLAVVEDACQGIGAHCAGRPVGTWGTLGCFSFHPNKLVGAPADGGMVVGGDPALIGRVRALAEAAWDTGLDQVQGRVPSRLAPLAIPVLEARLETLEARVAALGGQFGIYQRGLAGARGLELLSPRTGSGAAHRNCVLIADEPGPAAGAIGRCGWAAAPMYRQSVALVERLAARGVELPATGRILRHQLLLPMGAGVSAADQQALAAALRRNPPGGLTG